MLKEDDTFEPIEAAIWLFADLSQKDEDVETSKRIAETIRASLKGNDLAVFTGACKNMIAMYQRALMGTVQPREE